MISVFGAVLVQPWCNQGGKDGNYALCVQFCINTIERMDGNFPHGKDFQFSCPIRSQTPVLSLVEGLYPLIYGCVVVKIISF